MKRWALVVVLLYALIFIVLTLPVIIVSFWNEWNLETIKELPKEVFLTWQFPLALALIILTQIALLVIPVKKIAGRPVAQRSVISPILASAFLMGLLAAGLFLAVTETVRGESFPDEEIWLWISGAVFFVIWIAWGIIFYKWSKNHEPGNFIERICRLLFGGSILELLVAVPAHILARGRNYCCAGFGTFFGIAFGLSVMLLSFGPGIFFLYASRIRGRPSLSETFENK